MSEALEQTPVRVYLLGPPRIERDGVTVPVDTRKAIALLAYLVVTGRRQSRDHVATMLWPDADQTRARSALRRTLSALNTALGGVGLRIEREALTFTGEGVWVDVVELERSSSGGELVGAERYDGAFLEGFVLRDSPDFDDWQLAAGDDLRRRAGALFERLATEAPDPEAAIAWARRWLDLDPLHEAAHRLLMRCYERSGDRAAALRQYRACVAALERELGVEPLDATTQLYEAIRQSDRTTPLPETEARPSVQQRQDLPLVGRADELAELQSAYASLRDGHVCVIEGEAGIGKTRLASEFLASVAARGGRVVDARCHPEEAMLAFGTCVELLRRIPVERIHAAAPQALAEAARLVPELAPHAPPVSDLDSPAARRRVFEGVADVLSACAGAGGVVFVDDAQWIDESSRDVLRFLVRRLRGRATLVLLTWRTEEVPPADPMRRMLSDAQRAGYGSALVLQRLTRADVETLVSRSGATDPGTTLYEDTAGVPFFVAEYLQADVRGEPMPSGVRDLLSSRVEAVGRGAAQVLSAAAVLGRAFDPGIARETSGRTVEEVAAALDELSAAGLLVEDGDRYDFTHPKLGTYVYEATTLGRRRLLHGRAATALLRRARRHPELVALAAHHLERAGDEERAADAFVRAAEHARSVFANAEALGHYRSALALGHPDDADLHAAAGDLLTLSGRYADALASYEKAAALGADLAVVGRKLGSVYHRLGDWPSAEAHLIEAEEALGERRGRARILADRSLNAHRADLDADAADLAARALAAAQDEDDRRSLAQAHNISGILATRRGDVRSARDHLQASLEIAEDLDDLPATAAALNNLSLALRSEGAPDIALLQARRALDITRTIGDRHREAATLSNVADILRDLGRSAEAMDHVRRSVEILTEIGESDEPLPEIWKLVEW